VYSLDIPASATLAATFPKWVPGADEEAKPEEPKPARRVQGPLYGWRWWVLVHEKDGWRLRSTTRNYVWEGPTKAAHKRPALEGATGKGLMGVVLYGAYDTAGIHCYDTKQQAIARLSDTVSEISRSTSVLGCVEVSGTVVRHEHGYRAEKATIQGLTMFRRDHESWTDFGWMREKIEPTPEQIADLEETYQVDVVIEDVISGDATRDEYNAEECFPNLPCGDEERTIEL